MPYKLIDGVQIYTKEEVDEEFQESFVSVERARAEAAEAQLQSNIDAEVTRAKAAEAQLQGDIDSINDTVDEHTEHIAEAQQGVSENTAAIQAEVTRAKAAEQANADAISAEKTRALEKEGNLSNAILAEAARATAVEQTNATAIAGIKSKIPDEASAQNKLADKQYVKDEIKVSAATFRGSYATFAAVPVESSGYPEDEFGNKKPDQNDFIYVADASDYDAQSPITGTWRFKYTGKWDVIGKNGWLPEYQVHEAVLTPEQLAALNSTITKERVNAYDDHLESKSTIVSEDNAVVSIKNGTQHIVLVNDTTSTKHVTFVADTTLSNVMSKAIILAAESNVGDWDISFKDSAGADTRSISIAKNVCIVLQYNGVGFICEHTVRVICIDEDDNSYTSDVRVVD